MERAPILDSGATHCLLPLTWLSEEDTEKAKRIHLRVASGDQVRALLYNNIIYAKSVTRPLVSIGQLKSMIDLRFVWDDGAPVLLFCSDGRKYILLKAKVVHHLPLITTEELAVLLFAINACTTTGTLWDRQQWSQQLGRDFTTYGNSDVESAYPPVTTAPPVDASDNEAQTVEVSQFPTSATAAQPSAQDEPLTFRLEDQDAPTEPEIPIPLEAMHASMTTEDARRILLDHPLPRARQRTNVCTEDYVPQGRLFGAYTTRGEGMTQATFRFPLGCCCNHVLGCF